MERKRAGLQKKERKRKIINSCHFVLVWRCVFFFFFCSLGFFCFGSILSCSRRKSANRVGAPEASNCRKLGKGEKKMKNKKKRRKMNEKGKKGKKKKRK